MRRRLALVLALAVVLVTGCTHNPRSSSPPRGTAPIDLNTATATELQRLPGITATYARRIIAARPYKVKHELETRKILPPSVYARIRDRVIAIERPPPPSAFRWSSLVASAFRRKIPADGYSFRRM